MTDPPMVTPPTTPFDPRGRYCRRCRRRTIAPDLHGAGDCAAKIGPAEIPRAPMSESPIVTLPTVPGEEADWLTVTADDGTADHQRAEHGTARDPTVKRPYRR